MQQRFSVETRTRQKRLRFLWLLIFLPLFIVAIITLVEYFQPVVSPTVESSGVTVIFLSPTSILAP